MMRYLSGLICFLFIFSCTPKANLHPTTPNSVQDYSFDWLEGDWKRTNDEAGNRTFEIWEKKSKNLYFGKGWTMNGTDTISQEIMRIMKQDQKWVLKVSGVDFEPTEFACTNSTKNSFQFANDANDFPKLIEYSFDGKNINAQISGGGPTIPFSFEKIVLRK